MERCPERGEHLKHRKSQPHASIYAIVVSFEFQVCEEFRGGGDDDARGLELFSGPENAIQIRSMQLFPILSVKFLYRRPVSCCNIDCRAEKVLLQQEGRSGSGPGLLRRPVPNQFVIVKPIYSRCLKHRFFYLPPRSATRSWSEMPPTHRGENS